MAYSGFITFLYIIFHAVSFLKKVSLGADTLFPNQTLVNGNTLISRNQVFELGFFTPGASRYAFMGVWYKSTPDVVVWVANRENPITTTGEVLLAIAENGTLAITSGASIIWSGKSSGLASNPVLQLLDNGNLVIVDDDSESSYKWQSFDYPSDTSLPGMRMVNNPNTGVFKYLTSWRNSIDPSPGDFTYRIENNGLPEFVIFEGTMKRYRTGPWNGLGFIGVLPSPHPDYKLELVFDKDLILSVQEPYNSSIMARLTLDESGLVQRYSMNEKKDRWNLVYTIPRDTCDNYGQCGSYGICRIEKEPMCECLKGFEPKAPQDWDWFSGCSRIRPLICGSGDGFLEVRGVKYPDMLDYWLNTSMNLKECKDECLQNCSCVAYANPYITNGGSGCLMWFGELTDIREIREADSKQILYIRLPVSELESDSNLDKTKKKHIKAGKLLPILTTIGAVISCLICWGIFFVRLKKRAAKQKKEDFELPSFKLAAVAAATNNFSSENFIGEGGFGPVYRGKLSGEEEIAVKRLSTTSRQGLEEFKNEVILIAKLQHRNLVRLLGCSIEGDERLLIYEYMQNRSLDYFVFDENRKKLLTWPERFDIIMGISRGLLYLHHDSRLKVIHRDLKTSNILLDGALNPKISDFGLARIFGGDQTTARTKRVIGTYGYMAPEYAFDGKFSVKSDIFSMGVVLLEIVSGKKNRGFSHCNHHHGLLGHAWLLWKENRALELMDDCLKDTYNESQVKRCIQVALLCVQKFPESRPVMSSVVFMLRHEEAVLSEPKEPGFFMERSSSSNTENHILSSKESKKVSMIITDLQPR